jgi:hypothetical protein
VLEPRDGFEELALLGRRERGVHHVSFPSVHRWEQMIDDVLGRRRNFDEELAAILRMGQPADKAPPLQVVEQ